MTSLDTITSRLLRLPAEFRSIGHEPPEPIFEGDGLPLPNVDFQDERSAHVRALVEELAEALAKSGWRSNSDAASIRPGETFSIGTIVRRAPLRTITRGFVEPVHRAPLVERLPDQVVAYFMSLLGGREFLDREQHGFGWHYHYLDARRRRSDIILCWDTRWKPPSTPNNVPPLDCIRPLFQEKHGEGSRDFPGRPETWRDPKKQSMYEACRPDLKRQISEFKCAADKAKVTWPPGKSLTPRSAASTGVGGPIRQAGKKKR